MKNPTRIACCFALAFFTAFPCWAIIAVNWLDNPMVVWSPLPAVYKPVDINGDSIVDFTFGASSSFVGARAEGDNQYLIWPSGGNDIGGQIEPLLEAFEIGPESGDDLWIDWFGNDGVGFDGLITCLSGSGGSTCVGRFRGQHAYMGVEFDIEGATHYGWIDLLVASDNPYAEIYGWGYETDPGVSILAGAVAVPEPSSLMLLAGGMLTIGCTLRRAKARRG